jgi:translation elongation factor EF-4
MKYIEADRVDLHYEMPLNEIIYDFFDTLKSITRGYASLDYEFAGYRESKLVKLDMLINGEPVDAMSFIVFAERAYTRGRRITEKLREQYPAAAVRGADPGRDRRQNNRARDGQGHAQGRARQVLRRRHYP